MKTTLTKFVVWILAGVAGVSVATAAPAPAAGKMVSEGKAYLSNGQINEALLSFRQAAKIGSVDGACAAGDLLLNQAKNLTGRDRIQKSFDGLSYLFFAATNNNARACADLSAAYCAGIGVQSNLVDAYAWLKLAAHLDASFHQQLDQLVIQLDPDEIRQAQAAADAYQQGHWPVCTIKPVEFADPRLKIQGMTSSNRGPLVVVNGSTFAQGDSNSILPVNAQNRQGTERLAATCLEIGNDYVLLAVAGEPTLKLLPTDHFGRY